MKSRKKITPPKLRDYFKLAKSQPGLNYTFYFNTQIFNAFNFFCSIILTTFLIGFFIHEIWGVTAGTLVLISYLYFKTYRLCDCLEISREIPSIVREKTEMVITYTFSNHSAFPIASLSFYEVFDGIDAGSFEVGLKKLLAPHTQVKVTKKIYLNGGMGIKEFGPIRINFRDELGIFDFKIDYRMNAELEVFPFIEEIPRLKNQISPASIQFGNYEISRRGDSNLFIGTREYRHGDPVKFINWKLTKKTQNVIVNEYEKSTNTFVTIYLELSLKHQLGSGEISTWEMSKDLAISICHNEGSRNNLVQLISNNLHIPFGSGKRHLELFENLLTHHELEDTDDNKIERILSSLPANGQIYYICPYLLTPELRNNLEELIKLQSLGHGVTIFTLNPIPEMTRDLQGKGKLMLLELNRMSQTELDQEIKKLKAYGIKVISLEVKKGQSLFEATVQEARDFVEEK